MTYLGRFCPRCLEDALPDEFGACQWCGSTLLADTVNDSAVRGRLSPSPPSGPPNSPALTAVNGTIRRGESLANQGEE